MNPKTQFIVDTVKDQRVLIAIFLILGSMLAFYGMPQFDNGGNDTNFSGNDSFVSPIPTPILIPTQTPTANETDLVNPLTNTSDKNTWDICDSRHNASCLYANGCYGSGSSNSAVRPLSGIALLDGIADWEVGETNVSSLSTAQKKALCGAKIGGISDDAEFLILPDNVTYPTNYDWRDVNDTNWMTPVKSQGSCGSCWAFAVVGAVEATINIRENDSTLDIDLSEQHLVSRCCSRCGDCNGGYPTSALSYIQSNGIANESCFPYTARNGNCIPCINWSSYQITRYKFVANDINSFKYALTQAPIVVVMRVPDDWFYYRSGVYEPTGISPDGKVWWANHAIVLVGYVDDDSIDTGGYWIVKNSWGSGWGEGGYGKVKYGDLEQYNYAYIVEEPIIPSPPLPPPPIPELSTLVMVGFGFLIIGLFRGKSS